MYQGPRLVGVQVYTFYTTYNRYPLCSNKAMKNPSQSLRIEITKYKNEKKKKKNMFEKFFFLYTDNTIVWP